MWIYKIRYRIRVLYTYVYILELELESENEETARWETTRIESKMRIKNILV
ncbi:hypothetical protein CMALT394_20041 [Carnobacterium maltaromaticum]|nr:hypothetical protein CMALT394_20041 [Carnobacterium maltaromaticum]